MTKHTDILLAVEALVRDGLPAGDAAAAEWLEWLQGSGPEEQAHVRQELEEFARSIQLTLPLGRDLKAPEWSISLKQSRALAYYAIALGLSRLIDQILSQDEGAS